MKKGDRIESFVEGLGPAGGGELSRFYLAYFDCFNRQLYYEAHDVLEHLWLQDRAPRGPNYAFFKGLIQVAGSYVHLKKQYLRPDHPKDGRRLRPASRLFHLAMENLAPYRPFHLGLNVTALHQMCETEVEKIISSDYEVNPWHPDRAPVLTLLS